MTGIIHTSNFTGLVLLAGLASLVSPLGLDASVSYQTVAVTGDTAPGTSLGLVFDYFDTPVVDSTGSTFFRGNLVDQESAEAGVGLWAYENGELNLIVKSGDPAPGLSTGSTFGSVYSPGSTLNQTGDSIFFARFIGNPLIPIERGYGIWTYSSGSMNLVTNEGTRTPGVNNQTHLSDIGWPILARGGRVVFDAEISGTGVTDVTNDVIWSVKSGLESLIAMEGDPAPGTETGVAFRSWGFNPAFSQISINGAGQTIFKASLHGPGVTYRNDFGIWLEESDTVTLVFRAGDGIPGQPKGRIKYMRTTCINDDGKIALLAGISSSRIGYSSDQSILCGTPDAFDIIAREGQEAPGTKTGTVFADFGEDGPVLNSEGSLAFTARLTGPAVEFDNEESAWIAKDGNLTLIARTGQQIPGPGWSLPIAGFSEPLIMNNAGQVAFIADLGSEYESYPGICATDVDGSLKIIAAVGYDFDVNDDPLIEDFRDVKYVNLISGSGGQDGRATPFTDDGRLVFKLSFSDGTQGVFVATIPEPGTVALMFVGAGLMLRRR